MKINYMSKNKIKKYEILTYLCLYVFRRFSRVFPFWAAWRTSPFDSIQEAACAGISNQEEARWRTLENLITCRKCQCEPKWRKLRKLYYVTREESRKTNDESPWVWSMLSVVLARVWLELLSACCWLLAIAFSSYPWRSRDTR